MIIGYLDPWGYDLNILYTFVVFCASYKKDAKSLSVWSASEV